MAAGSALTYTTPKISLTYNLRVGSTSALSDILGLMSYIGARPASQNPIVEISYRGCQPHGQPHFGEVQP